MGRVWRGDYPLSILILGFLFVGSVASRLLLFAAFIVYIIIGMAVSVRGSLEALLFMALAIAIALYFVLFYMYLIVVARGIWVRARNDHLALSRCFLLLLFSIVAIIVNALADYYVIVGQISSIQLR